MKYLISKEIAYARLDHEILAFDSLKNMPYVLNPIAALIFSLLEKELNAEEIAARLCRDYEVHFHEALADTREILDDLATKEIIVPAN